MNKIQVSKSLIELNEAYNKAMIWFFSFPDAEISLSELAKELRLSKTTVNRVLRKLEAEGFLRIEVLGKIWRISCNKDHAFNASRKIAYNLTMVSESGILREIHKVVENPRSVILFGSYRKGDDNEKSDIDIAVEVLGDRQPRVVELGVIPRLGFRRNVRVNLYIFSRARVDLNVFSNISNGIVLEGFLEVKP